MSSLFSDIFSANSSNSSDFGSGSDFWNGNLFNTDETSALANQALDFGSINTNLGMSTYAPSSTSSSVISPGGSSPSFVQSLENLLPSALGTAESILKTQYSVPQTQPGQYLSVNPRTGQMTTGTLPVGTSSAIIGASTGLSLSTLLIIGAGLLAVVLVSKGK